MATVLVVSVGGSCAPVVNGCREFKPDFVYFLCSGGKSASTVVVDGDGNPCGDPRTVSCPECGKSIPLGDPRGPSITRQLGLSADRYEKVLVEDPDDLEALFRALDEIDRRVRKRFAGQKVEVIANYTGGTKTMSVALALMAVLRRWDLSLSKGPRKDLIKVKSGDIPVRVDQSPFVIDYHLERMRELLNRYDYRAADEVLGGLIRRSPQTAREELLRLRRLCRAFSLWDAFDHSGAYEILEGSGGSSLEPYIKAAARLSQPEKSGAAYEAVVDLLYNAERRAEQGRYDDAVGRLYRALELLAQLRLRMPYGLDTGRIDVSALPEGLRAKYASRQEGGRPLQLALVQAYLLLDDLEDGLGRLFRREEKRLLNALQKRNHSIMAHGQNPIGAAGYQEVLETVRPFVKEALAQVGFNSACRQLPRAELCGLVEERGGGAGAGHR